MSRVYFAKFMSHFNHYIIVILLILYSSFTSTPSPPDTTSTDSIWTLKKCVNHALENNLQIKQTQLDIRSSNATLLQNKLSMLPSLNGDVSHSYQYGRSIDPTTNDFVTNTIQTNGFSLNSNLLIFEGLRKFNTLKQTQLKKQARQSALAKQRNTITLSVLNQYLNILLNRKQLAIAQNQLELAKQQLQQTKRLVKAGKLPEGELLELEAQVANEELSVTQARNQVDIAYTQLKRVMRLEQHQSLKIKQPSLNIPTTLLDTLTVSNIYQEAVKSYPSIMEAKYRKLSRAKGIDIAQSNYSPRISVFGQINTNYSDFRREATGVEPTGIDTVGFVSSNNEPVYRPAYEVQYSQVPFWEQIDENLSQAVGISMTIPIFNGWQARTAVEQAKVSHLKAEYALEQAKYKLEQDIQQSYTKAKAAYKKYQAAQKNLEARRKAFKYAKKRFENGAINSITFTEAKNKLSNARSDKAQSKYEYIFRIKMLKFYQGKSLNF